MSGEKPSEKPPKVGIGPSGAAAALIQLIAIAIGGWIFFVYLPSAQLIGTVMLPGSLFMLVWLGILVLIGGCWPLAPPLGRWKPGVSRAVPGLGMTVLWWILTLATALAAWSLIPLPEILPFGVTCFWLTLLWGVNLGAWPLAGKVKPGMAIVVAAIVIYAVAAIIYAGLVRTGVVDPNYWVGLLVWHIAWFFVFSPVFITQGSPFRGVKPPGMGVAQLILAFILAFICWDLLTIRLGLATPLISFAVVASGIVMWSLVYSWMFSFVGVAKYKQPKRGALAFVVMLIIIAVWTAIIWGPLQYPLKLPVELMVIYFNLCVVTPALIAHNAFWLRAPLTLPAPPGTPPPDQGV
jgi:hypothetical protein